MKFWGITKKNEKKNGENLKSLSPRKCLEAYLNVLANSKEKEDSAKLLAGKGHFNTAISLLIISNEEAIKALILYLEGHKFRLRNIKGFNNVFDNHKLRYLSSLLIMMFSILGEDLKVLFIFVYQKRDKLIKFLELPVEKNISWLNYYICRRYSILKREIQWFENIDKQRQLGFYSDSLSSDKKFQSEMDYEIFFEKINYLNDGIKDFLGFEENSKQIPIVRNILLKEANKAFEELGKIISKINQPKFDSYGALLLIIEEAFEKYKKTDPSEFKDEIEKRKKVLIEHLRAFKKHQSLKAAANAA